jgi:hypothetical protein
VIQTWPEWPQAEAKYNNLTVFGYLLSLEMPPAEGLYERKRTKSAIRVLEVEEESKQGGAGVI